MLLRFDVFVDVHDEKHAKEALGSKSVGSEYASEGGGVTVACDTDLLYNPSIPTERPKVGMLVPRGGACWLF